MASNMFNDEMVFIDLGTYLNNLELELEQLTKTIREDNNEEVESCCSKIIENKEILDEISIELEGGRYNYISIIVNNITETIEKFLNNLVTYLENEENEIIFDKIENISVKISNLIDKIITERANIQKAIKNKWKKASV